MEEEESAEGGRKNEDFGAMLRVERSSAHPECLGALKSERRFSDSIRERSGACAERLGAQASEAAGPSSRGRALRHSCRAPRRSHLRKML